MIASATTPAPKADRAIRVMAGHTTTASFGRRARTRTSSSRFRTRVGGRPADRREDPAKIECFCVRRWHGPRFFAGIAMDRPRTIRRTSWSLLVVRVVAFITALVTPVTALGAWLLLTDPAVAADVAANGDLWPLVEAVVDVLSSALKQTLSLL
jgi:hypothetical protein